MSSYRYSDNHQRACEVVFQRGGYDVETLYWAGSVQEVRELAEAIARRGGADAYRIVELSRSSENAHLSARALGK
jgi:hypothetical protein